MLMFLQRNPSVLFAFVVILFIWLSHLRSDCIVTSRYLALSACSSWCPCRVHVYFTGILFRVMDILARYICQNGRPFSIFVPIY